MTCIHENEVNKIAECNLLHDILNPSKHTENLNSNYSNIVHACINTQRVEWSLITFENYRTVDLVPQL